MAGKELDYRKTPADQRVGVWIGPKGSIANFDAPTAAEINSMILAPAAISWNDFDFGLQASETNNDPSLADVSNYEDFGAANFGGSISFYYPREYDKDVDLLSVVYDLTDKPGTELEIVIRIDGDVKNSVPAEDGDLVSVYAVETDSESNSMQGADAMRRTVGMLQKSRFSYRVPVGSGVVTVAEEEIALEIGEVQVITPSISGRRVGGPALRYASADTTVATVTNQGVVVGRGSGSTNITVTNEGAETTTTVDVLVP